MKQTRQAVHAVKQSIFLRRLWSAVIYLGRHEDLEVVDVFLLDQLLDLGLDRLVPDGDADLGRRVASRVLLGLVLPRVVSFNLKNKDEL